MNERYATVLYSQYMTGRLSLSALKEQGDQKKLAAYAGLKGEYIGQYVYRTMRVKHSSGKYVAIMPVLGTLTKRGDLCSYGMRDYMNEIQALNDNEDIVGIVMDTEGPGGTVDGTTEFGMAIRSSKKPIVGYGDCMVASADYWAISQTKWIIGNKNNPTEFGSIGVLCVHEYWGKFIEENIGEIKIIRAPQSTDKALVNPIEQLSADQEKLIKADLKNLCSEFHGVVKAGRGDRLKGSEKEWGTGKMFNNQEAIEIGLIDAEGTLMDAIDKVIELSGATPSSTKNAKKQGASQQINKSTNMTTKEVARKVSSFFTPKKAAAKAAAAEPAAAEGDTTPLWTEELTFNTDGSGDGAFCIHPDEGGVDRKFETKIDNNQGNEPPTDPAVTEDDNWSVVADAGEGEAEEDAAEATTVVKLNAALKKRNAEIKTLKAEISTLKGQKTANEKKPAAPATTVVKKKEGSEGEGTAKAVGAGKNSWEQKAAKKFGE
jgi:protease-4